MNFGNFLWAATGMSAGYRMGFLQFGGGINSRFSSRRNGYPSQPDSIDDQFSIAQGFYYADRRQWNTTK